MSSEQPTTLTAEQQENFEDIEKQFAVKGQPDPTTGACMNYIS